MSWTTVRPRREHIVGSVLFGTGWAVADACPGPIAAQLGQGVPWALATAAGLMFGVYLRGPVVMRFRARSAAAAR